MDRSAEDLDAMTDEADIVEDYGWKLTLSQRFNGASCGATESRRRGPRLWPGPRDVGTSWAHVFDSSWCARMGGLRLHMLLKAASSASSTLWMGVKAMEYEIRHSTYPYAGIVNVKICIIPTSEHSNLKF